MYVGVCVVSLFGFVFVALFGLNDLCLTRQFGVQSHRLDPATVEQKGITQTIILTPVSQSVSRLSHYCQAPS